MKHSCEILKVDIELYLDERCQHNEYFIQCNVHLRRGLFALYWKHLGANLIGLYEFGLL